MDEKEALIQELIKQTEDGKLEWTHSSSENEYALELSSALFTISYEFCPDYAAFCYIVNMHNGTGAPIEIVREVARTEDTCQSNLLYRLFIDARESCVKENKTIREALSELKNL